MFKLVHLWWNPSFSSLLLILWLSQFGTPSRSLQFLTLKCAVSLKVTSWYRLLSLISQYPQCADALLPEPTHLHANTSWVYMLSVHASRMPVLTEDNEVKVTLSVTQRFTPAKLYFHVKHVLPHQFVLILYNSGVINILVYLKFPNGL